MSTGVNFTNILRAAFTCEDPKSAKKDTDELTVILLFWDLHELKLHAHKQIDEIDPRSNDDLVRLNTWQSFCVTYDPRLIFCNDFLNNIKGHDNQSPHHRHPAIFCF